MKKTKIIEVNGKEIIISLDPNDLILEGDEYVAIYYGGSMRVGKCKKVSGRVEDWNGFTDKNGRNIYYKISSDKKVFYE